MRKLLLATSALVAFAGAAQAAEAPITVNVGGYVDFRAGFFREAVNNSTGTTARRDSDFETEYRLNIEAVGKAAKGVEYGGLVSLWNGAEYSDATTAFSGGKNNVTVNQAYVWLSGAFGKAVFGDDHGASDLFEYMPTIGAGQIDGIYTDFTDPTTLAVFQPAYIDNTENSTKITYYTPKVGNENHKVQAGVSYTPNFYDNGQNVVKYDAATAVNGTTLANYQDMIEAAVAYNGQFGSVGTVLTANLTTGTREASSVVTFAASTTGAVKDFTSYGVGGQVMYSGFTFGGSYVDAGRFGTVEGQNKTQEVWGVGLKYEFDRVALAGSFQNGRGYYNTFAVKGNNTDSTKQNYVKDQKAYGLGATYTWFPGLTTAADAVFVRQHRADNISGTEASPNNANVFVLSQKITF